MPTLTECAEPVFGHDEGSDDGQDGSVRIAPIAEGALDTGIALDAPEVMSSTKDGNNAMKETEVSSPNESIAAGCDSEPVLPYKLTAYEKLYPHHLSMATNQWGSYRQTTWHQYSENPTDDTETMLRDHDIFTS